MPTKIWNSGFDLNSEEFFLHCGKSANMVCIFKKRSIPHCWRPKPERTIEELDQKSSKLTLTKLYFLFCCRKRNEWAVIRLFIPIYIPMVEIIHYVSIVNKWMRVFSCSQCWLFGPGVCISKSEITWKSHKNYF